MAQEKRAKKKCSSRRQGEAKVQPLFALYLRTPLTKLQDPSIAANRQAAKLKVLVRVFVTLHTLAAPDQQTEDFLQPHRFYPPDDSHFIRFMYLLM
jgi:hypothetical protein